MTGHSNFNFFGTPVSWFSQALLIALLLALFIVNFPAVAAAQHNLCSAVPEARGTGNSTVYTTRYVNAVPTDLYLDGMDQNQHADAGQALKPGEYRDIEWRTDASGKVPVILYKWAGDSYATVDSLKKSEHCVVFEPRPEHSLCHGLPKAVHSSRIGWTYTIRIINADSVGFEIRNGYYEDFLPYDVRIRPGEYFDIEWTPALDGEDPDLRIRWADNRTRNARMAFHINRKRHCIAMGMADVNRNTTPSKVEPTSVVGPIGDKAKPCSGTGPWTQCLKLTNPEITILASALVSQKAMKAAVHIFTDMTSKLKSADARKSMDGLTVHMTNGEDHDTINSMMPIKTCGSPGYGLRDPHFTRGCARKDWAWVSEQMMCKTGVKTRTEDYQAGRIAKPDIAVRSFDQLVHEFSHTFQYRDENYNRDTKYVYQKLNKGNEPFAVDVQAWFGVSGTPPRKLPPERKEAFTSYFNSQGSYTCAGY